MRDLSRAIIVFLLIPFFVLGQEKVNINAATIEELQTITGVGPAYAQRIIDNRPFSSLDDLIRVKGIGEKTLQKIKDQGLAYIGITGEEEIIEAPVPQVEISPEPVIEETPQPIIQTYPKNISFIEIVPSPEGPDDENESAVPTTKLRISAYLPLLMS